MKHVIIIFLSLLSLSAFAQNARRDSLIHMGRALRNARMEVEAMRYFTEAGGDLGRYEMALTRYSLGEYHASIEICKELIKHESLLTDDANLLIARIRDAQGLKRIARLKYNKLVKKGNADAAFYFALMQHRSGHNNMAVDLLQKSIRLNKANVDAHVLLAQILIDNGQRYLAMLPLMYSLLLPNDTADIRTNARTLESLWSSNSDMVRQLHLSHLPYVSPATNAVEDHISNWNRTINCPKDSPRLLCMLPLLLEYLQLNQSSDLDWWQIVYADFFVSIREAGFEQPFLYLICTSLNPALSRNWVENHEADYAEFLTWLSFQR